MAAPPATNRLDTATSLYLRQHADNPVDWQLWDKQARDRAEETDTPIFLSVGYAACHWCHVMEEESFNDSELAEVLNDAFVPVKVDRESHPAVDLLYQRVAQRQTRSGGWPLSVWLTPDGRPFGVGTYYPPTERHGRPAFETVLREYATEWATNRGAVEQRADEWTAPLRGQFQPPDPRPAPEAPLAVAAAAVHARADAEHGGWGNRTKFPHAERIRLLLGSGSNEHRETALQALDAMASGGIYDHLGGGFHRYATDKTWTVPHYEKMLYDNAELAQVYARAYEVTGRERYRTVTKETVAFVRSVLGGDGNGFAATVDARSTPPAGRGSEAASEGAYYTWTADELTAVLDERAAALVRSRFGVTGDEPSVLSVSRSVAELAEQYDSPPGDIEATLTRATATLAARRRDRPNPRIDQKVVTAWNGMMVRALTTAGTALGEENYLRVAETTWRGLLPGNGSLHRCRVDDEYFGAATLADYAFLGQGIAAYAAATDDPEAWAAADSLAQEMLDTYWAPDEAVFYLTPADRADLIVRPIELIGRARPSSVATAIGFCQQLAAQFPEGSYGHVATEALGRVGGVIDDQPLQHVALARVAGR